MPGGRATRPGDIVKSMSGQTVEILNTDAEGRLILCDAITYASRFKPRCIIDVATLTGACVIALGHVYTGLFCNDEPLARALLEAADRSLDLAWRMPVHEEYGESLRSNFADFANSGTRDGGASVGANFLSRFVDGLPWAHLDIAGVAWRANANKGATGRPVPLLVDFLLERWRAVTQVDFYILDSDSDDARLRLACKIVDKATQREHHVFIHSASDDEARKLDELLWTFSQGSFIPHRIVRGELDAAAAGAGADRRQPTAGPGRWDVLINLAADVPEFFSRYERVAEVVDAQCRAPRAEPRALPLLPRPRLQAQHSSGMNRCLNRSSN